MGCLHMPTLELGTVSSSESSPSMSNASSGKDDLNNDILMWNTYQDFSEFCSKIGITLNSTDEAKIFFDFVRFHEQLPVVNFDHKNACVEHLGALFI